MWHIWDLRSFNLVNPLWWPLSRRLPVGRVRKCFGASKSIYESSSIDSAYFLIDFKSVEFQLNWPPPFMIDLLIFESSVKREILEIFKTSITARRRRENFELLEAISRAKTLQIAKIFARCGKLKRIKWSNLNLDFQWFMIDPPLFSSRFSRKGGGVN